MTYDALDGYVLLFGGYNHSTGAFLGDTWSYSLGLWTPLHPRSAPSARLGAAIAYDAKDRSVTLYGGYNGSILSDQWSFTGGQWTKLTVTNGPGRLEFASMAYDANDSYVVLFGGYNGSGSDSPLTWSYVGGSWAVVRPHAPMPAKREGARMAYNVRDGRLVLFGGLSLTRGTAFWLNDSWTFSAGNWTRVQSVTGPSKRENSVMAYDPASGKVVLFGGLSNTSQLLADTWTYGAGIWTKIGPLLHPSGRDDAGIADGARGGPITLFGGDRFHSLNDTWTFAGGGWRNVVPPAPAPRGFGSVQLTYDEADGCVVLFGGFNAHGQFGDTWEFAAGHWKHVAAIPSPPARAGAVMAYDSADGYVLLFGGESSSSITTLSDTWTFSNGTWTQLTFGSMHPDGRKDAMMTYDAADGYVLLYGGYNSSSGYLHDSWGFASGVWTTLNVTATPAAENAAGMTYDSTDGYVLLFGGGNGVNTFNATWTYSNGIWTNISSKVVGSSPGARDYPGLVDDSYDGYVLLYGGDAGGGVLGGGTDYSDTWEFVGGTWTQLTPSHSPTPVRQFAGVVYDARDSTTLLFGGISGGGRPLTYLGDTWLY